MNWWNEYFPAWLEAISTALALVAATVAAIYAVRVYRREDARERRQEDLARRAQASLVSAWVDEGTRRIATGFVTTKEVAAGMRPPYREERVPMLYIRNASALPVSMVECSVRTQAGLRLVADLDVLPPSESPKTVDLDEHFPDLAWDERTGAEITFRDSGGIRWSRDGTGILKEVDQPGGPTGG